MSGNSVVNYIDEMLLPVNGSTMDYLSDSARYPQIQMAGGGEVETFTQMARGNDI